MKLIKPVIFLFFISLLIISCVKTKNIEVHSRAPIKGFSSGSGMAKFNNNLYAIGDDDAYLWEYSLTTKEWLPILQIWDNSQVKNGRIPGKVKPDFEAMITAEINNSPTLIIFGSGTKVETRENILLVNIESQEINIIKTPKFYNWLRSVNGLSMNNLNLEGAAIYKDQLILSNRSNNQLYFIDFSSFETFLNTEQNTLPQIRRKITYDLPVINKDTARFSSLEVHEDKLFFSASIESTETWTTDGEIKGSFVGEIDLKSDEKKLLHCLPITSQGKIIEDKVEGITFDATQQQIHAITDNDDGSTFHLILNK